MLYLCIMIELKGLENAWLSPTGRIVVTHPEFNNNYNGVAWHNILATCIFMDIKHSTNYLDTFHELYTGHKEIYEQLEDLGWIRLHGYGGLKPRWIIPYGKKITKSQENVILDWCNANNESYGYYPINL